MTWFLASLFFLFLLTALVSWFVLYVQFSNSVEKRWATEVLELLRDAERCVHSENQQFRELNREREAKTRSLHEKAFASHLCDYSVSELEAYPGIGPGTINKLRAAGFLNLAILHRAQIHVHGLGEKRLTDINSAIHDLLRKARSTFEGGECRQARALADQMQKLSVRYDRLEIQARTRVGAAEQFIEKLEEIAIYARAVKFRRWLRPISNEDLIPAEILDASLPDLEAALRAAEDRCKRNGTANRYPTPANAEPVLPISPPQQTVPYAEATKHEPASTLQTEPEMPDETHLVLMELTIQFAWGVARTVGPVTWTERELIQQHIRKRFSYNRALLNRAESLCAHYETAAIDWEQCMKGIMQRFTPEHRGNLMTFAGQIVAASGKGADCAAPFLHGLAQRLRVPPAALPLQDRPDLSLVPPKPSPSPAPVVKPIILLRPAALHAAATASPFASPPSSTVPATPPRPTLTTSPPPSRPASPPPKPKDPTRHECLDLLEIPQDAPLSADLVRRQWNLLSQRLDPEKVASMGTEFVNLAQTKLASLRRAAEWLLQAMGEKLETDPPAPPVQDSRHNPDLDDVFGGM